MKQFLKNTVEMYAPFRRPMLIVLGFVICSQTLSLVSPYLFGSVIDSLVAGESIRYTFLLVTCAFFVWVIRGVVIMYWRERYEIHHLDHEIPRHVSAKTIEKLLGFSLAQHISENSGIKQSIITRGKHSLTTLAYTILYQVLPTITQIIIMVGALLYLNVTLGLIVLIGVSFFTGSVLYINFKLGDKLNKLEDMSHEDSRFHSEVLRNVELVISNAQEERAVRECDESIERVNVFSESIWVRYLVFAVTRNFFVVFTRTIVLAVAVYFVYQERYTVGYLVIFLSWSSNALDQVARIGYLQRQIMRMYISVKKYFEMLEIESDVHVPSNPVRPEHFAGRIEFRNVTMHYHRRVASRDDNAMEDSVVFTKDPALDDVSFVIESGETVAIVGESGAGKTTIVHALLRAQDPEKGQIIIDSNDLRVLDLKLFRGSVGVVQQDVPLFDQSIRYNITYGLNGQMQQVSEEELERVAKMACIDRFFPRLENGFDTLIGERGVKLSGGERQRVGIARALIKEPDILIFDEATSNLDPENEALIRQSIEEAAKGRTTIIIAHRFSTIRRVNKVLVFDKGRLVGEGTHKQLAQSCPEYKKLIQHQLIG